MSAVQHNAGNGKVVTSALQVIHTVSRPQGTCNGDGSHIITASVINNKVTILDERFNGQK